jgi:hypothetical protein
MIRFIRDPQPPHNSLYRDGMVRDLGAALNAQFIASGDAVDFVEPGRLYPPARVLAAPGTDYIDPATQGASPVSGDALTAADFIAPTAAQMLPANRRVSHTAPDGSIVRSNATDTISGWMWRRVDQPASQSAAGLYTPASGFVPSCHVYRASDSSYTEKQAFWVYVPLGDGWYDGYRISRWDAVSAEKAPNVGRHAIARMGKYLAHDNAAASKSGSWTNTTADYVHQSKMTQSSTVDGYVQFADVVGASFVLRCPRMSSLGCAVVSIDGDFTAANRLPTFTAADETAGKCRAEDVGRRYIDFYAGTTVGDVHIPLADGLADAAHTVRITVTGTKRAAASGVQVRLAGLVGISAADAAAPPGTGFALGHVENVFTSTGLGGEQALPVFAVETTTPGTYQFAGGVHSGGSDGIETVVSWSMFAESTSIVSLSAGTYATGRSVTSKLVSTLATSDAPATVAVTKTQDVVWSAANEAPMTAKTKFVFAEARKIRDSYTAMMSIRQWDQSGGGAKNWDFPQMQMGPYRFETLGTNAGNLGYVQASDFVVRNVRGHLAYVRDLIPDPGRDAYRVRGSFANDSVSLAYTKAYLVSVDSLSPRQMAVGDEINVTAGWGVVPNKA